MRNKYRINMPNYTILCLIRFYSITHPYIFSYTCGQGYGTIAEPSLGTIFPIRVKNKAWIMPCLHEIDCHCIVHVDFRNIVHGGNMNIDSNSNWLIEFYFRKTFDKNIQLKSIKIYSENRPHLRQNMVEFFYHIFLKNV